MARHGSVSRLVAWTGVAPGHDASVGKQHSGKTRKGNCVLHTDGVDATGARGGTRERDLSLDPLSAPSGPAREKTGHHRGGPRDGGQCLP
jgi:hypothetical protein